MGASLEEGQGEKELRRRGRIAAARGMGPKPSRVEEIHSGELERLGHSEWETLAGEDSPGRGWKDRRGLPGERLGRGMPGMWESPPTTVGKGGGRPNKGRQNLSGE